MTTVGKILVVLHLVLSIMFMAFAGAVFTAQTNWKKAETAAQASRQAAEQKAKKSQGEYEKLLQDRDQARADFENVIQKLKVDNKRLDDEIRTITVDNKQLRKEVDQQRDQAVLTTTEAIERKKEADLQREKNGEVFQSREELEKKLAEELDKNLTLEVRLQELSEKFDQAVSDIRTMKGFLSSKDLTTDPKQMVALTAPPPPLLGRVLDVLRPSRSSKQEFIEISIGSDSGLEVGHSLTVYRGEKYLGVIRLTNVTADKSVGVVAIRAKNAEFKMGDEVSTKF